jgi:hypothetical protein
VDAEKEPCSMTFNVIVQHERTGDKATQQPSDVVQANDFFDALDVAEHLAGDSVERVTIERTA